MAVYNRNIDKRRLMQDIRRHEEEVVVGSLFRLSNRPESPKAQLEQEKKIRREIANSNERRRMQSINAGFQSLRTLLPQHDGEKLSKAAILQQTADYIYLLEQEKTRLLSQNCQLKRQLNHNSHDSDSGSGIESPRPKKRKTESVESDEGIGGMSPDMLEPGVEDMKKEMIELRVQLERERRQRISLVEQVRQMDEQAYPSRIQEMSEQGQLQPSETSQVKLDEDDDDIDEDEDMKGTESMEEQLGGPEESRLPVASVELENPVRVISPALSHHTTHYTAICRSPPSSSPPQLPPAAAHTNTQYGVYHASTSRQNLETIVEAIRHLEGDHMFRDDPVPRHRMATIKTEQPEDSTSSPHLTTTVPHGYLATVEPSYRQQIIRAAPAHQTRPGVIVSTHT